MIQGRKGFTFFIFAVFLLSCGPYVYWSMTGTRPPAFVEAAMGKLSGGRKKPAPPTEKQAMLEEIQAKISEAGDLESRILLLSEEETLARYEADQWGFVLGKARDAETKITARVYYDDAARKRDEALAARKVLLEKKKVLSDEASRMMSAYERRFGAAVPGKEK